jgi:hypothetical protein
MGMFAPEKDSTKPGFRAPGLTLASESAAVKTEVKKAASFSNSAPCAGATTVWKGGLAGSPSRQRAASGCSTHASPSSVQSGRIVYEPERGRISKSRWRTLPWLALCTPQEREMVTSSSFESSRIVESGQNGGQFSTFLITARRPR